MDGNGQIVKSEVTLELLSIPPTQSTAAISRHEAINKLPIMPKIMLAYWPHA